MPTQSLLKFEMVQVQYDSMSTTVTRCYNNFPAKLSNKDAMLDCLSGLIKIINGRKQMQKNVRLSSEIQFTSTAANATSIHDIQNLS